MRTSLQVRLSLTLSVAILVVAVVAGAFSFMTAFDEANELQDDVLRQVAALVDRQDGTDIRLEAAMCKMWGTEAAWNIVNDTLEIRGGRGLQRFGVPMERDRQSAWRNRRTVGPGDGWESPERRQDLSRGHCRRGGRIRRSPTESSSQRGPLGVGAGCRCGSRGNWRADLREGPAFPRAVWNEDSG